MEIVFESQETYSTIILKSETLKPLPSQNVLCYLVFNIVLDILSNVITEKDLRNLKYGKGGEKIIICR